MDLSDPETRRRLSIGHQPPPPSGCHAPGSPGRGSQLLQVLQGTVKGVGKREHAAPAEHAPERSRPGSPFPSPSRVQLEPPKASHQDQSREGAVLDEGPKALAATRVDPDGSRMALAQPELRMPNLTPPAGWGD